MSALNDQFARLDANYGFRIETPPVHTGMLGIATPWRSARQNKNDMLKSPNMGAFIVLTRDKFGGSVELDKQGEALVKYPLHKYDRNHLIRGIKEAVLLHAAAGAEKAHFPHPDMTPMKLKNRKVILNLDTLSGLDKQSWKANRFGLYTAHQMGTCRMGGDAKTHPTRPDGRLLGYQNIYIADASAFPASSGTNPMISIMGLTHHTIQGML